MSIKKILTSVLLSAISYQLSATLVSAQTPTATSSADSLRDSVKQKVTQELAQIQQAVAKKSFVGNITSKTDVSLTLNSLTNQSRSITLTTDTTIKLLAGKDGTVADVKTGDYIIVMGDVNSQNVMTAKRLIVIAKPTTDKRTSLWGTVSKTTISSITLTSGSATWTIKVSSSTKYTGKTKLADIKAGDKLVLTGTTTGDTALTASKVHTLQ